MSIKDLFNDIEKVNVSTTASNPQILSFNEELESSNYAFEVNKDKKRFVPNVDFSKPENFARYGSAEEYYKKAIEWIYGYYPYDGSLKDKEAWHNSASYLENYVFESQYPRTNGYALLCADGWGTQASTAGGYGLPNDLEYISFKSGPHEKNIWDASKNREENLKFDITNNGATVEFWLKKNAYANGLTDREVVFDLWNSEASNQHDYGRLRIELSGTSPGAAFRVTVLSGTSGAHNVPVGETVTPAVVADGNWAHYAFTLGNKDGSLEIEMYRNGAFVETVLTGSRTGHVTGSIYAYVGANTTAPKYTSAAVGSGKLSGSLDDFRYWKTKRTARDIGRYYISQVGGGANTDDATTDLGVYFKFNEGITTTASVDSVVLDYSGRLSNGAWTGYDTYSRSTGSAMVLSGKTTFEFKDPIIYSNHPEVSSLLTSKQEIGEIHDISNPTSIYKSMPAWILEDDENSGSQLKYLTQIMGNYFDELYNQIENLPSLKNINFPSSSATTGSFKPYPFSDRLLTSHGVKLPELFVDSTVLEHFSSRNEEIKYEEKIYNVKNLIYQNIYNNLSYIYKSKGTTKSINNLIRAFGANEDVISVNVYAQNLESELRKNIVQRTIRKKVFDFNNFNRTDATIFQFQTGSGTTSFISGAPVNSLAIPTTIECEVIFPKKAPSLSPKSYSYNNLTSSIFGQHTAVPTVAIDNLLWATNDVSALQVYAVRPNTNSKNAYFILTGSNISPLTTDVFDNVYDNEKWNFAVRFRPENEMLGDLVFSGSSDDYKIEFYGVSQRFGTVTNEFLLTTNNLTNAFGREFTNAPKRLYAGAHRTNFTGTLLQPTDVKVSNLRYWFSYLDNDVIKDHATNMYGYGPESPYKNQSYNLLALSSSYIPYLETLALNWDFRVVSSSADASGRFLVDDFSSGSAELRNRYGWLGAVTKQLYSGRADFLTANETDVCINDYIFTTKNRLPEQFNSDDMISIGEDADKVFTKDTRPVDYFFSIESSLYRVISEEIVNIFASVLDFNNLIGEPVNKYRKNYKDLDKLRQLFFERVRNEPDTERYFDYFIHVDSFIQQMLEQLIPASSNVSDSILNIVESHVLERNKYEHKFPYVKQRVPQALEDPSSVSAAAALTFDWENSHNPAATKPNDESVNCFYWKNLADRGGAAITSGDTTIDSQRNTFKNIISSALIPLKNQLQELKPPVYMFKSAKLDDLGGGPNLKFNNLFGFHKQAIKFNSDDYYIKFPFSSIEPPKKCDKDKNPVELIKTPSVLKASTVVRGETVDSGDYSDGDANLFLPFTIFSSSVSTGYRGAISSDISASFENMHRDVIGRNTQNPLQGPFTQKYVGGLQYRHAPLNYSSSARSLDTPTSRAEGWFIQTPIAAGTELSLLSESFSATDPTGWRNVGSTATGPSGWILTHSGPTPSVGTGPNSAFDGTYYAYAETSAPNHPASVFGLVTPMLDADDVAGPDFSASFYYHMHGVNVGNLKIQHSQDPSFLSSVTDLTVNWDGSNATFIAGQQQANATDAYKQAKIDLTSYAGTEFYLRFLYAGGITYLSDVALDAIEISGTSGGSVFKLLDPAYDNPDKMRAVYYRDEVAKRPLNIKNIQMVTGSPTVIGNYSNNYEVVNIPGRDVNNLWFVQNSGSVASLTAQSEFLSGNVDFSLANRNTLKNGSKNKTVIAERFSAPGGPEVMSRGFLDVASETYSVYNCLNYRNSTVRNNLNIWEKHHSIWGGYDGVYGAPTASFHKVQRNTGLRIEWSGANSVSDTNLRYQNVVTASYYDNGFISHQIPQTSAGYAWISGSLTGSII